eukprot:CAMPEP_0197511450 /NCGR_PEP_ID=MMETSP1312-20131121/63415_1 /TAXON_ID=464262 /ORGANISM="Genus nov. species nov., Strain RCC2335" /LENGTH=49 /DNA_ID=CAMNT_0043059477 /DNA_START=59 /DNA_END=208 /DNA_ORIENTATION=+
MAYTPFATLLPFATAAACLTSSILALVQDPMKTLFTGTPSSGTLGSRPM